MAEGSSDKTLSGYTERVTESHPSLVAGKQITKGVSLLKPLTSGGMGAVWLADHLGLKTQVVVKFMLGSLDKSDSARTRFSREAAAAAQVKSPHVVQMLDHGVSDDGVPFIVMEHLEGHDLGDEIDEQGALEPAKVVAVITQVAKALSKVHAAGFLHRDIKPANIFLVAGEEDVFVKLLDFGIAKNSAADQGDGSLDGETKTGQVVGTPFYMSPEQVTAQKTIDHRSDLWALGVVAYEALTGKRPYDGPSFGALAVKIATEGPPRPTQANPSLPPALDAWFARACAREASERFSTAKELSDAFRAAFEGVSSLPSPSLSTGDSGQRSVPGTPAATRLGSGSDETSSASGAAHTSSKLGLAATALDDSAAKERAALGRSEAGVSEDVRPSPRSSRLLYVGGAIVLSITLVFVLVTTFGGTSTTGGATPAVASTPTTPKPERSAAAVPRHATSIAAPPATVSAIASVSAAAAAPPDASAPISPPSAPPRTTTRPPRHSTSRDAVSTPTKPSAEPPTKPPTTKPTDSTPDLF